ncbi:MAG: response regulator [Candidatus Tenebribacter davisii]|nr:response regulator [Candidatus Tenebribacter davisii]
MSERKTLLLVDDAPENLDVLKGLLSNDYNLKAVPNGKIALKIAGMNPHPDLILLDILMPIMDGFEVLQELQNNEDTKQIPVILLSALDSEENIKKGMDMGAVGYIPKPFEPDVILNKVEEILT